MLEHSARRQATQVFPVLAHATSGLHNSRCRQAGQALPLSTVLDGTSGPPFSAFSHVGKAIPVLVAIRLDLAAHEPSEAVSEGIQHQQLFENGQSDTLRGFGPKMCALGRRRQ